MYIQGGALELTPPPPKMTQNDMKCHFESFFGVEIFAEEGVNFRAPPCKSGYSMPIFKEL